MKIKTRILILLIPALIIVFNPVNALSIDILREGFESYPADSYPAPPWSNLFPGVGGYVTTEQAHSGSKSFRSGAYYDSPRVDYVRVIIPDRITYRGSLLMAEEGKGASIGFAFIMIGPEPSTASIDYSESETVHFDAKGNVSFLPCEGAGVHLMNWQPDTWYSVEVEINHNKNRANVYINDSLVGNNLSIGHGKYKNFVITSDTFMSGSGNGSAVYFDDLSISAEGAEIDIRPASCPNPLNVTLLQDFNNGNGNAYGKSKKAGVLPVALVGSEYFDVTQIRIKKLALNGIRPLRFDYEDVTRPAPVIGSGDCPCTTEGPDGILDLTLKFSQLDVASTLYKIFPPAPGNIYHLTLSGMFNDKTPFQASDCVLTVGKDPGIKKVIASAAASLGPAVPNPFNPVTSISFYLPSRMAVSLDVFDSSGRLVRRLIDGQEREAGNNSVEWRGLNSLGEPVNSGVYFYRLKAGGELFSRKMVLLR